MAKFLPTLTAAADYMFEKIGSNISVATPLGLGKPNGLVNELYARAKKNSKLQLNIYTALSLNPPMQKEELGRRFFEPFAKRQWGENYPRLAYADDAEKDHLPDNVRIHEFYFRAGSALKSSSLQRNYQSINYTHVAESLLQGNIDAIVQMIARKEDGTYSLSCNPDITLDLVEMYRKSGKPFMVVGVVHPDLPFLGGDAQVGADFFDVLVENPEVPYLLFALPRMPINPTDHMIGFYASQMILDGGTLQVGIGSLSDAVVSSLLMRHQRNDVYQELYQILWDKSRPATSVKVDTGVFKHGLYGLSEMVTDAYMHMRRAGILKREVIDERSGAKTFLHGAFYLGSKELYEWLRTLKGEDYSGLRMTRVSKVNDLYDPHEVLLRQQRRHPRFLNTCMQVTLLGGAASETLPNGTVVSGVGGQYNFVAMAAELRDSRSILMLRSTRGHGAARASNIVWSQTNLTIPRHLRDVVITEYGIADLRNRTDEECIRAMIEIADAQFQDELVRLAQKHGKLSHSYQIPAQARKNTPDSIKQFIKLGQKKEVFKPFAVGSDFTPEEQNLILALGILRNLKPLQLLPRIFETGHSQTFGAELRRMHLDQPKTLKEKIYQRVLLSALYENSRG